jgi:hypothetical protein
LTADDKKNYTQTIQNALAYHGDLTKQLAQINRKKDVPVLGENVYRYCNKFEEVSS